VIVKEMFHILCILSPLWLTGDSVLVTTSLFMVQVLLFRWPSSFFGHNKKVIKSFHIHHSSPNMSSLWEAQFGPRFRYFIRILDSNNMAAKKVIRRICISRFLLGRFFTKLPKWINAVPNIWIWNDCCVKNNFNKIGFVLNLLFEHGLAWTACWNTS